MWFGGKTLLRCSEMTLLTKIFEQQINSCNWFFKMFLIEIVTLVTCSIASCMFDINSLNRTETNDGPIECVEKWKRTKIAFLFFVIDIFSVNVSFVIIIVIIVGTILLTSNCNVIWCVFIWFSKATLRRCGNVTPLHHN